MIDLFSYDPTCLAGEWHGPALIVQGNEDIQLRPHDADLLKNALPQARCVDLAGGTHLLKTAVEGIPFTTYPDRVLPPHGGLIPGIVAFPEEAIPRG